MKKVVIVSGVQIIGNPRVVKEAGLLSDAGYDVEVIGIILDIKSKMRIECLLSNVSWKHIALVDLTEKKYSVTWEYFFARLKNKIFVLLNKLWNIESPHQLGLFVNKLYKVAESRNADLYIVHLEKALWVGRKLINRGCNVAIDVEDWYSEDGLPEDLAKRPIKLMKDCESYLLKKSIYSTTTSHSLASALKAEYQCPTPTVIYNSFPSFERKLIDKKKLDRVDLTCPSIIWFSQTIGPGRGLELLIRALNEIDLPFELHIRGTDNRNYFRILLDLASDRVKKKIFLHEQVFQKKLLSRIFEHDIGYCGDLSDCRSRHLTITNKMMEYLRSGLAVIASDTCGHCEISELTSGAVSIFQQNNVDSLVCSLKPLLSDGKELMKAKKCSYVSLTGKLGWEVSAEKLKTLVGSKLKE